jgi:hypothetical protein
LGADGGSSVKAEEFAGGIAGLEGPVGKKGKLVSTRELPRGLRVDDVLQHSERKARIAGSFFAVEIGAKLACVREPGFRIFTHIETEAGGEPASATNAYRDRLSMSASAIFHPLTLTHYCRRRVDAVLRAGGHSVCSDVGTGAGGLQ